MQLTYTFRHMDATDALKSYTEERLGRIKKYFPDPIVCNVVLSANRFNHRIDVTVTLHNGYQIAGHETTENMYSSIDLVTAKLERQVRKYKDKLRHHKTREGKAFPVTHTVVSETVVSEQSDNGPAEADVVHPVIKRDQMHAQPMVVSEAIMQLNLLHQDFFVFLNDDNGQFSVLYRRDKGEYGLIEAGVLKH